MTNKLILNLDSHAKEWIEIYQLRLKTLKEIENIIKCSTNILVNQYSGGDKTYFDNILLNIFKLESSTNNQLDRLLSKETRKALHSFTGVSSK